MSYATNEVARELADSPVETVCGYEVTWDGKGIIIYDDVEEADRLAEAMGTYAKHSKNKHPGSWETYSIVGLKNEQ